MTATDELRRMLDERGVEHYDGTERTLWGYKQTGEDTGIYRFAASELSGGYLQFDMFRITPEQAIAATLGSEREKQLELLVKQLWYLVNHRSGYGYAAALESIEELGIEVDE